MICLLPEAPKKSLVRYELSLRGSCLLMYYPWQGGQSADWDANGTDSTFFPQNVEKSWAKKSEKVPKHKLARLTREGGEGSNK